MKKLISLFTLIFVLSVSTKTNAYYMYAPDGRQIQVDYSDAQIWRDVGWYDQPVTELWSNDGRQIIVYNSETEMYKKSGWFDANEKTTIYAPDGRTASIKRHQLESYLNVGWYDYPVTKLYAPDGRTIIVSNESVSRWESVGWYKSPIIFIGKTFNWLSNYFGGLHHVYNYKGGEFFSPSASKLNFGFSSYELNYYDDPCVSLIAPIKVVFPDLAATANQNGYISKENISKYFNYSYEYGYDAILEDDYTGRAKMYNNATAKMNLVLFPTEYDGSVNANLGVEILNK